MTRSAASIPLLLAALIAGCGSSSHKSTSSAASSPAAGALTLNETEFKITPASVHVAAGHPVTLTVKNSGAVAHALAVQTAAGVLVKTAPIAPGSTATLHLPAIKPGSYTFYCPIANHRRLGMQGSLVVGSAAATPAAKPAASSSPY